MESIFSSAVRKGNGSPNLTNLSQIRKGYVGRYARVNITKGKSLRENLRLYESYEVTEVFYDGLGRVIAQLVVPPIPEECNQTNNYRVFVNIELLDLEQ